MQARREAPLVGPVERTLQHGGPNATTADRRQQGEVEEEHELVAFFQDESTHVGAIHLDDEMLGLREAGGPVAPLSIELHALERFPLARPPIDEVELVGSGRRVHPQQEIVVGRTRRAQDRVGSPIRWEDEAGHRRTVAIRRRVVGWVPFADAVG